MTLLFGLFCFALGGYLSWRFKEKLIATFNEIF